MRWILFIFVLLFLVFLVSGGGVIVSITDGYIYDIDGNVVRGANVVARDSQCSDTECRASTISQNDGYYVVGNYKFFSSVIVEAIKGTAKGSVVATPDSFNNIKANVVICDSPSGPVLMENLGGHDSVAVFEWKSGIDSKNKPIYDEFKLDGSVEQVSSILEFQGKQIVKNVGLGVHNWGARTCNNYCCSEWVTGSFSLGNSPPSKPIGDYKSSEGVVSFSWVSGIDPDGDVTHDEFQLEDEKKISPALSPVVALAEKLVRGKVKTCDNFNLCSEWVEINGVTCEEVSVSCPDAEDVREVIEKSYSIMESIVEKSKSTKVFCNGIEIENGVINQLNLRSGEGVVRIQGNNFSMSNLEYCPWCYDGIRNYDELDVDCGGSCILCEDSFLSSISKNEIKWIGLLFRAALLFIVLYYHYSNRRKIIWA